MNKLTSSIIMCLSAGSVLAQPMGETETIMQQMQAMEKCMAQIDYRELEQMEQHSTQVQQRIIALCQQGNELQARRIALQFSDEVMQSQSMQTMQKCASLVPGMQQQIQALDFEQELGQQSICEYIQQQ